MKTEKLLADIRSRLDIVDVISDYVELKRSGQNYKGLCPFHSEKTPSFMVSPDKQIFHCFGCSVGGNIVNFVMKYENLPFSECLKLLAKKAGINISGYRFENKDDGLRGKLIHIHTEAAKIFAVNLKQSKEASTYLSARGLAEETTHAFSLGYALRNWHQLSNHFKGRGFPDSLILQSGIASSGEKGIYDVFRDRIIFPICDVQGTVIAFGGRVMDDSQPKYLNSPDTLLFKKSETLYGLDRAKEGIRKNGYAVIAEGYFDVVICHQYGFNNAVAPLGTALTAGHLQKLRRFAKKAVLVFDGDEAGKAAARRSIPLLLEQGIAAKILLLPENDDPDSFLRRHGGGSFNAMLSRARTAIEFILDVSEKDRTEIVHEAIEIISAAGDMIMKEELINDLSERTGIRETILREELKRLARKRSTKVKMKGDDRCATRTSEPCIYDEETLLLSTVIAFPDRCNDILSRVSVEEFKSPAVRSLLKKLNNEGVKLDEMLTSLTEEEKLLITRLTINTGLDLENVDKNIDDCIRKIIMRRHNELIKEAELKGDLKLLNSLLLKRQVLVKKGLQETGDYMGRE